MVSFFCHPFFLASAEDKDPILVELSCENPLMPLYIPPSRYEKAAYSKEYLNSLEKVLAYDMDHNGMTHVIPSTYALEKLSLTIQFNPQDLTPWIAQKVNFIVQLKLTEKILSACLLIVNSDSTLLMEGLSLTGNLQQDRRLIHVLSDKIHKALFDCDGIASSRILFTLKKQDPRNKKTVAEVYEVDYDGGNLRQITHNNSLNVTPAYIPSAGKEKPNYFVFVSYEIGQPKIYLGQLNNGKAQRFSLLKGNQLMPTLSRQRNQVAFICDVTGNPDLFLQNFDMEKGPIGKPRQIFATHKAAQGTPTFSPDGKKIAFVSNKDGQPRIYVMDIPPEGMSLKDIKAQLITKASRENSAPSWSPDGSKIAFCALTKGVRQIWIYDVKAGREFQLTRGPGNKENPSWAPNSLHLVFNSTGPAASELYLTHVYHPKPTQVYLGSGEKHFPSWETNN